MERSAQILFFARAIECPTETDETILKTTKSMYSSINVIAEES